MLPPTFCVLPFTQATFLNDGRARLCCRSDQDLLEQGESLSLHQMTIGEIWNAAAYQRIRAQMLAGKPVPACQLCAAAEAAGGASLRQVMNDPFSLQSLGFADTGALLEAAREMVSSENSAPRAFHLWLGNRCNLKCRMCSPHFSSQIALDPVHRQWSGGLTHSERLLPRERRGVRYWGWGDCRQRGQNWMRRLSTGSAGGISFPTAGMAVTALSLQGWNYGEPLTLSLQTQRQNPVQRLLPPGRWQIRWDWESETHNSADFELVLALEEEGRWLEIDDLTVALTGSTPQGEFASPLSRLSCPTPWVNDDAVLEELLAAPQNLRLLQVSGGEPLLQRRFYELIETLVKGGYSSRIQLYISTNGMVYSRRLAQLLKEFRSLELGVSIDGYGALQEYIRYPAQWALIERHLFAYRQDGLPVSIRATPQAYNIFGLLDLARWCQQQELPFYCENILWSPRFLSLDTLPQAVINEALKDFVKFLETERNEALGRQIQTVISVLRRPRPSLGELTQLQRQFIEFTQALDESRSQGLAQACPRLYENLPYFASSSSG